MGGGIGGFLNDVFGEGGYLRDAGDWVDENIFGKESTADYYKRIGYDPKSGKPPPFTIGGRKMDNIVARNVGEPIGHGLEKALDGLNWLYSNGVSQPISTFLLAGTHAESEGFGEIFKGSNWSKAWHVAEHVSPGQAFWADHKEVEEIRKDQPVYAEPALSSLPPGWKDMGEDERQAWLKGAGMPIVGNRAVKQMQQDHAWFNFASGATDFAARWWLDPVILGGKGVGAVRAKAVVKPRPKAGWSGEDIDKLMADSTMAKAQDFLWANRENPALINNLDMFKKSALGPRAGGIISTLRSPEEVNLFLRTSLGDAQARVLLQERNAVAASRLEKDTGRLSELDLALPRVVAQANPRAEAMVQAQRAKVEAQINADEALTSRYTAMLDHYRELDAINLTRFSFGRAERRTRSQAAYSAGPALGSNARRADPAAGVTRIGGGDYFGSPMAVVRSFKEAHPNGTIQIDDLHADSVAELRAHVARVPGIGPAIRQDLLNRYLRTTTEGERLDLLDEIGNLGVSQVAKKHGFTKDEADALYQEYRRSVTNGQEELRRYSAGVHPGEAIHLDEFMGHGGKLTVHPNMVTRLANDHVLIDLKALDTTLARHGSALKALRVSGGNAADWMLGGVDYLNHLWKFGTLFRLGYIPRVLSDDLAGQVARLGTAAMAMRTGYGAKNLATNLAHWKRASMYEAQEAAFRQGVQYADDELALLRPQADLLRTKIETRELIHNDSLRRSRDRLRRAQARFSELPPVSTPLRTWAAHDMLIMKHLAQVRRLENVAQTRLLGQRAKLGEMEEQLSFLNSSRENALRLAEEAKLRHGRGFRQNSQLYKEVQVAPGVVLPPAFGGAKGEYYQKMISSDDSLRNLFATNKKMVHGNLMRSFSHSGVSVSYPQNPKLFVESWHQAVNNQIMQDPLAVQAVKGASINEMTHWLGRTPAGRAYRKRLGLRWTSNDRIATSVYHDVESYMPDWTIRQAAMDGKADIGFLSGAAQKGLRPFEVHSTSLGENLAGSNHHSRALDRVIDGWFKVVASLPADRFSRHPLFNQLYEGHAQTLASQEIKQGMKISQKDADQIAQAARRLALRDTRRLVFDIAHRSDAGAALRFISPFFSATTEAWQRWSRIIADRPQVVGYAGEFFHAPISMGWMQDSDGNKLQQDGTVIDPVSGKKRFVPKGDRYIMARVPKFVVEGPIGKAFKMDGSGRWLISQDSMNLVTQGDPFFNPGTGPIVSIPVNEFVKDKPSDAELARHLGVLPFGPTAGSPLFGNTPLGRAADLSMPATVKNFLTAFDTTDERYQRVKLQIMQKAAYEHATKGKAMPSAREIADMTRNYWLKSAAWSFSQPAATQRPDEYQMYRDQYNNLRRKNPLTADEEFLSRFDESFFIFAQAQSKNRIGAEATKAAVELSKQHEELLAQFPELGALIIGPEGSGPFSPEAYTYQLTHPLTPGGSEMQRTKLSAEEAMKENERRRGWAKFTQLQNALAAELHSAGFESFADSGAEELKAMKGAVGRLLGEPMLPDGSPNPYYNEAWSEDFNTFDPKKYDRMIPGLAAVAFSDQAENANRSDLRALQTYLTGRQALMQELQARGATKDGAKTLRAKSNADLATNWARFVDSLIEQDTRFGDLHSRYLSRDLGIDVEELANEEAA